VDLAALQSAGIVSKKALGAKIILAGKLSKKLNVKGDVKVSKGARSAIESAGGKVEVAEAAQVVKKLPKKTQGTGKEAAKA
jgi:large subunit ribosomal protein L15